MKLNGSGANPFGQSILRPLIPFRQRNILILGRPRLEEQDETETLLAIVKRRRLRRRPLLCRKRGFSRRGWQVGRPDQYRRCAAEGSRPPADLRAVEGSPSA